MTDSDEVSSPRYTLRDDGDFLRLRWAPGITMQAEDVHSTIAAVTAAFPEDKRPLLVHIGLVERITPEAKQLIIDDTCSTRTAVVGVDEVSRVLTACNYRSATPSRYFTDESEAIAWLLEDTNPNGNPDGFSALWSRSLSRCGRMCCGLSSRAAQMSRVLSQQGCSAGSTGSTRPFARRC